MNRFLKKQLEDAERDRVENAKRRKSSRGITLIAVIIVFLGYFLTALNDDNAGASSPDPNDSTPPSTSPSPSPPADSEDPSVLDADTQNISDFNEHIEQNTTKTTQLLTQEELGWELVLINKESLLPRDFKVNLQLLPIGVDDWLDSRIIPDFMAMMNAASAAGIQLYVVSAYRDVPLQATLYSRQISQYTAQGYSKDEAAIKAGWYVQPPGASEHHTGLAVDLLNIGRSQLTSGFGSTDAYTWLKNNAANYGFIERYPSGKEDITEINWEPWHYRYVGVEHALAMTSYDLVLEEYLQYLIQGAESVPGLSDRIEAHANIPSLDE